jgi:hypothetical protein
LPRVRWKPFKKVGGETPTFLQHLQGPRGHPDPPKPAMSDPVKTSPTVP